MALILRFTKSPDATQSLMEDEPVIDSVPLGHLNILSHLQTSSLLGIIS